MELTPKQEKAIAIAIANEIIHGAMLISQAAKGFPKRRKWWIAKVWFYFSDRKKTRTTAAKIVIFTGLCRARLTNIISQPIPKFERGGEHAGGPAIVE